MFDIFSNDNLSSESMQKLAFDVLENTRDFPFKLPSDAIYILRVSAIIEGLGTTYIENFNGIKDILPILQKNIPKALGANESILETLVDEIKSIPFTIKDFKSVLKQASSGELKIQISNDQVAWISKEIKDYFKPIIFSTALFFSSIFILLYDKELKEIALGLFIFAIARLIYR
jgi:ubiquinone biosynthesis protein